MKYRVYGSAILTCSMIVEANSEDEAIEVANEEFGGLTNYAGMGSCDCLVGVLTNEDERSIYADGEADFNYAEEIE